MMSSCPLQTELAAATWLPRQQPYLVGVSGGVDSMVLLHLLHQAGYQQLTVCHLHHGLREEEADLDADLVRRAAEGHGLAYHFDKHNVRELAGEWRCSVEAAGRRARHRMFACIAARTGCPRVLLGHHADDQFETVLINLFRGSASLGRCGMQTRQSLQVHEDGVSAELTLLRPLLGVRRQDILDYATRHRLEFREDSSNRSSDHLRNRVRHELVPQLREWFGRDPSPALLRLTDMAAEEEQWLGQLTLDELQKHRTGDQPPCDHPETLDAARLLLCPPSLRRRVVHLWLQRQDVSELDSDTVQRVLTLLEPDPASGSPARVNLPGDRQAGRTGGRLWVRESS